MCVRTSETDWQCVAPNSELPNSEAALPARCGLSWPLPRLPPVHMLRGLEITEETKLLSRSASCGLAKVDSFIHVLGKVEPCLPLKASKVPISMRAMRLRSLQYNEEGSWRVDSLLARSHSLWPGEAGCCCDLTCSCSDGTSELLDPRYIHPRATRKDRDLGISFQSKTDTKLSRADLGSQRLKIS